jgi:hypothetical protein
MTEQIGVVRNPLTVVAIFAGIAEVSGSVVLPFVASENQRLYIYFLIWFPIYLVTLFFLVLLCKHKVLYAPSDFKDDKSFMELLKPGSQTERLKRIDEDIKEELKAAPQKTPVIAEAATTPTPTEAKATKDEVSSLRLKYLAAEELVISLLSRETGLSFDRNSQVSANDNTFTFDATAIKDGKLHAVEIKLIRNTLSVQSFVRRSLERAGAFINSLGKPGNVHFTLVVVLDSHAAEKRPIVEARLHRLIAQFSFVSSLRTFTLEELQTPPEES